MKDKLDELMDGFLDISSPDALREKIMMKIEFKTRKNRNTARLAVLMGVSAMLIYGDADGLVLAATGQSLTSHVLVSLNGQKVPMEVTEDKESGQTKYKGELAGSELDITLERESKEDLENADISIQTDEDGLENGTK